MEFEEPQDLRPEEGDELHGLPRGSTEGEGITATLRLRCIGGGFDTHVTNRQLLRDGWKFELEMGPPYAFTPQGQKLLLDMSDDTLVLPHEVREGKEAERLPPRA